MDDFMNLADSIYENEQMRPLLNLIEQVMALPDDMDEAQISMMVGVIKGAMTQEVKDQAAEALINILPDLGLTQDKLINLPQQINESTNEFIKELKPSAMKEQILQTMFDNFNEIIANAIEIYTQGAHIVLPFKLDEGAKLPTYAHSSDACADVYASEDVLIKAHTVSNLVHTGIHIALPDGWQARLAARSSIGAKTPIRISNATPIIDTGYRGEIKLFFDNNSDSDYQIKAGDRIAQMWVEPVYRFTAKRVDILPEATERGEAGIGSTGK